MSKHTPGPWKAYVDRKRGAKIAAEGMVPVVNMLPDQTGPSDEDPSERFSEEAQANARLIAAAPELLEACEQAEFWLTAEAENPGEATPDEILRVLRAAIAKAVSK